MISYYGSIETLEISKALILSVRNVHSRYLKDIKLRRQQAFCRVGSVKKKEKTQKELDALDEQIQALKK